MLKGIGIANNSTTNLKKTSDKDKLNLSDASIFDKVPSDNVSKRPSTAYTGTGIERGFCDFLGRNIRPLTSNIGN